MSVIWKYPLSSADKQTIHMPSGATILSVHEQYGVGCLWALVDPEAPQEARTFTIYGTGQHGVTGRYVGTFYPDDAAYVFHVFEDTP